ncbi:MAG: hypothetical protein ABR577_16145 [Pyrinomonadaceae bacterium]
MKKKQKADSNIFGRGAIVLFLLLAVILSIGCGKTNAPQSNTVRSATPSPTPQSAFERDLQSVRSSQTFDKVYVFARKDSAAINAEDGALLKAKAPADPHIWWVVTDERRRVIMGTYSDFAPEKLNALRQHFNVEDYTNR